MLQTIGGRLRGVSGLSGEWFGCHFIGFVKVVTRHHLKMECQNYFHHI